MKVPEFKFEEQQKLHQEFVSGLKQKREKPLP